MNINFEIMKIDKKELLTALEKVKPGVTSDDHIEQANTFVFKDGFVITYNDEISLCHPVTNLDIEGSIVADEFYKLLKKLKDDYVTVTVTGTEIQLKSGKAKAGLILEKDIKLPLKEIGAYGRWRKLPDEFSRFARFAMGACSNDYSRPVLSCVNVRKDGMIQGTDSCRIVNCNLDRRMPVQDFMVSARSIKEIIKIEPIRIAESKGWIHFTNREGTIISCRTYEDDYVDIDPFLEVKGEEVEFPKAIIEVIDRARIFAKRDSILDERITVTLNSKEIIIEGSSTTGWFQEKIPAEYDGVETTFSIAPYLLADILNETGKFIIGKNSVKFTGDGWVYIAITEFKKT